MTAIHKPLIHIDTLVRDADERRAEGILARIQPNIRSASIIVLMVLVPSAIIYGLLFAIAIQAGVDPTVLVRDPATISNVPFYFGLISNLGILAWAVAASVSAFGGWLVYRWSQDKEMGLFLMLSGAATTVLLLDDFFLFHDQIGILYLGIREIYVFAAMALLVAVLFFRFRNTILHTNYLLLAASIGMIAFSIFLDREFVMSMVRVDGAVMMALEELFKLLGIVIWATYFVHVALTKLSLIVEQNREGARHDLSARLLI